MATAPPPPSPQVNEVDLDRLCDGESDVTGLQWPLHVRDRLPMDILRVLPGAIKAVGNRFTNKPREPAAADHQGEAAEHDAGATLLHTIQKAVTHCDLPTTVHCTVTITTHAMARSAYEADERLFQA